MFTLGHDIATGDILIRNHLNGTALRVAKDDISMVAEMLREEYPACDVCEGTMVDGYCVDCGEDYEGRTRDDGDEDDEPPEVAR